MWAALAGAYAPDLDMVYFYLIDHRQHHHHTYWTHVPALWAALLILSLIWYRAGNTGNLSVLSLIFALNAFIHMLLDSIVGDIWWLAPLVDKPFTFFTVPALYKPWWLNFIVHWSFVLELMVVYWAFYLWRNSRSRQTAE